MFVSLLLEISVVDDSIVLVSRYAISMGLPIRIGLAYSMLGRLWWKMSSFGKLSSNFDPETPFAATTSLVRSRSDFRNQISPHVVILEFWSLFVVSYFVHKAAIILLAGMLLGEISS